MTLGDGSFATAQFTNEKGGVYEFLDNSVIEVGAVPTSRFVNEAGAVEKTSGTGDSFVEVTFQRRGGQAATGTIEFQTLVGGGSYTIEPGTYCNSTPPSPPVPASTSPPRPAANCC